MPAFRPGMNHSERQALEDEYVAAHGLPMEMGAPADDASDTHSIAGGAFLVNSRGLRHYAAHGYKGRLRDGALGGDGCDVRVRGDRELRDLRGPRRGMTTCSPRRRHWLL